MANDKDFLLKNAVEVGGPTKVTLGTITSNDIDLSTGNYFNDTLTTNTTYTISNTGDVQLFQLEVTGGVGSAYEVANTRYDSKSFDATSQDSSLEDVAFKTDGTKMYAIGRSTDSVYQYSLSTAWDVSTASYDSVTLSVSGQDTNPQGIVFKSDGTRMYVVGNSGNDINQYDLSTAWDLSTASFDNVTFSIAAEETTPYAIFFKPDGTKFWLVGTAADAVFQYSLSTAWNIGTASYDSVTLSVSSQDTNPRGILFNDDGTKMYILGGISVAVLHYTLSTAWDLSTASYDSVSSDISAENLIMVGMSFGKSGEKLYIIGTDSTNTIYQYSTTSDTTITWPSSIEWSGGTAPAAPANGETDVFTITTDDGGISYVGVKTADNLS